jgi:2-desacetyl-2-hydroxyethyl bacteriochlorophyllide A dehydrogenase
MKSVIYTGPRQLEIKEANKPKIKDNEVLLQIKSVGICGTDLHIYNGGMNLPTPLIMGHEFSGVVIELGKNVSNFKKGDHVTAEHVVNCGSCHECLFGKPNLCSKAKVIGLHLPGALAGYVAVPVNLVYKIPKTMSFEEGALIEPLSIAYYAVKKAGSLLGKTAVVIGQGPIGLLVDQILKQSGVKVIGVDIFDWRLNFAKKNKWVDYVINSKKKPLVEEINKLVLEGVDMVFEAVGQETTAELSLEIAKREGDVFILGVFEAPVKVNLMHLVKKELNVHGSWTCSFSFAPAIELVANKKIDLKKLITHRYKASQTIQAFKEAASYNNNRIKTVINF